MKSTTRNLPYTSHFKLLDKMHPKLSGHEQAEFNFWRDKKRIKYAIEQLRMIEIVPTIYQKEQPDKLRIYYYPSKVYKKSKSIVKKDLIEANYHSNFKSSSGIIIEGTVGQGKSILLRHLHISELNSGESIPIFIELKDIKKERILSEFICSYISNTLKLRCSEKLFNELLKLGLFSFFFDGFDEIEHERRNDFVAFISHINDNNGNLKTFVTSRPGNEIQRSSAFELFGINPLEGGEQISFVNKLLNKKHKREQINYLKSNLEIMNTKLRTLLTTPLILTLFAMVYRNKIKIPDSYSAFYRTLFDTLVSEHDGLKLGLNRPTKSGLPADRIKTILEYLSLRSIQKNIKTFSSEEFLREIKAVLIIVGLKSANPKHVIEDLTKNTCLIQVDDMDYRFLHESIPNYFAASCIANNASDEEAAEFYKGARGKWKIWTEVIEFLLNIDKRRCNLHFLVPEISSIFNKRKLPSEYSFTNEAIQELSKNIIIGCIYNNMKVSQVNKNSDYDLRIVYYPTTSWVFTKYFGINGHGVSTTRLTNAMKKHIGEDKHFRVSEYLLKNQSLSEFGSSCIITAQLFGLMSHINIEKAFFEEASKLLFEPIKDVYTEACNNEERVISNKSKNVFGA